MTPLQEDSALKKLLPPAALLVAALASGALAQDNVPIPTPRPDVVPQGGGEMDFGVVPSGEAVAPDDAQLAASHFVVIGLAPDDLLNLRASASATGMMIGRLQVGATVKNLGCAEAGSYRWCKVGDLDNPKVQGWAAARYLQPVDMETIEPAEEPATGEPDEAIPPAESERSGQAAPPVWRQSGGRSADSGAETPESFEIGFPSTSNF